MTDFDTTIDNLRAAQDTLEEALRSKQWSDALAICERIGGMLTTLAQYLDEMTKTWDSRHDQTAVFYNRVVDQHNAAIDTIAEAGELPGWRIGDVQTCGCEVEPIAVPCDRHEAEWGQAQTDCGDCQFGVPGVRHWNNGCEVGQ